MASDSPSNTTSFREFYRHALSAQHEEYRRKPHVRVRDREARGSRPGTASSPIAPHCLHCANDATSDGSRCSDRSSRGLLVFAVTRAVDILGEAASKVR
jgi:hypothetical protein